MSIDQTNVTGTGIIYRNPKPHVFSRHAYFPWIVGLENGDLIASFVTGEAFESIDSDTCISRSSDEGLTWSVPQSLLPAQYKNLSSNCARLTNMGNNELAAMVVRSRRESYPEEGLANPENMGFVPTELLLIRSFDAGKSWTTPALIEPPLTGPSFEACSPIVLLKDGRWIWPTSTWRGWNGYSPNGMKMVALVSHDQGKTWPEHMEVMDSNTEQIIYWEGKIVELSNGLFVAVSWVFDEKKGVDLKNHFTISRDKGKTWTAPASTNIQGQTMALTELPDGRLLAVYRRTDKPGLWITTARLTDDTWINEDEFCLWGGIQENKDAQKQENMVHEFNELKFGAPCITILPDHTIFIAFWCYEKMVSNIRWFKLVV
ncbi:sialidase family protein [Chitinophaga sp. MM2321]|uniref:sialidase family protein n=1 Tax=Chitinophaga sp. MM2321 TaxID=3137178 RepID=UPI0032D591FA